jgi:ArsR family transcriptional regulator, arsenate/arsenite/antimonite-responsive transcriptional repressor
MRLKHFSLNYGSQIFKAFSDESRVRILYLLYQNKQLCIADLVLILDFTQSKTSRHINYLKNSRIVAQKRFNNYVFYYIVDEVDDIISQIFKFLNKDQTLIKDQETAKILYNNRELALYQADHNLLGK